MDHANAITRTPLETAIAKFTSSQHYIASLAAFISTVVELYKAGGDFGQTTAEDTLLPELQFASRLDSWVEGKTIQLVRMEAGVTTEQ
jgi:hypothetical protein